MTWRDRVRRILAISPLDAVRVTRRAVRRRGGLSDRRLQRSYFATEQVPKLHLGCGSRLLEGWLNTDLEAQTLESMRLDAAQPLPFDDATFDYVYSEHMIEHLDHADGCRLLGELARVLRPGGRIRVATPDLEQLLGLFVARQSWTEAQRHYAEVIADWRLGGAETAAEAVFILNNNVRDWGHRFLYDEATLRDALAQAGFTEIRSHGLQDSDDPVLSGLAHESRLPAGLVAFETMTLEAVRP